VSSQRAKAKVIVIFEGAMPQQLSALRRGSIPDLPRRSAPGSDRPRKRPSGISSVT